MQIRILLILTFTRYGSSSTAISDLQRLSKNVTVQLESWWCNLPPALQIKDGVKSRPELLLLQYVIYYVASVPELIFSSMAYHHIQILIHRPWTSRGLQPNEHRSTGTRHARQACSASASSISQLLIRYENDHGFPRMHDYAVNIIFSAALISLFNSIAHSSKQLDHATATADLSVFFRALDDLSRSFNSAKRAREHLATIQRKWYVPGKVASVKRQNEASNRDRERKRAKLIFGTDLT